MGRLRPAVLVVGALAAAGACSSDSNLSGDRASPSTSTSASAFCDLARLHSEDPAPDPFAPGLGPSQVEDAIDAVADRLRALADAAPEAIAPDVVLLLDAFADLDTALAEHGYDLDAMDADGVTLPVADDPAFAAVGQRLADHLRDECGIRS